MIPIVMKDLSAPEPQIAGAPSGNGDCEDKSGCRAVHASKVIDHNQTAFEQHQREAERDDPDPEGQKRRYEKQFHPIVESVSDEITIINRSGVILSQSRAVSRMLGYGAEELVGRNIFELIYEEDLNQLYNAFFSVTEGFQQSATVQFYHPARDGTYRLMEANVGKSSDAASQSVVLKFRPAVPPAADCTVPVESFPLPMPASEDHSSIVLSHGREIPLKRTWPSEEANEDI